MGVETGQDFFVRKPRATMENWNDQLTALNKRFGDTTVSWTAKEQSRDALQSFRDLEKKFRGDDRFPQDVIDDWETKLGAIYQEAEKVWTRCI